MTPDPDAHLKSEHGRYLSSLDFTGPLRDRVQRAINFYTEIAEIKPSFLFVSEYWDNENRVFDSLWLFSQDSVCEAKRFIGQDYFDCIPLGNRVNYWEAKFKDFDWNSKTPRDSSRFTVHVTFDGGVSGTLQASGNNCLRLVEVLRTFIVPNLNNNTPTPAQSSE